jgi:hypothetical protein
MTQSLLKATLSEIFRFFVVPGHIQTDLPLKWEVLSESVSTQIGTGAYVMDP